MNNATREPQKLSDFKRIDGSLASAPETLKWAIKPAFALYHVQGMGLVRAHC
jgi:hypothetical protein